MEASAAAGSRRAARKTGGYQQRCRTGTMNPKPPFRLRDIPKGWPEGRDLMHVAIGFLLLCGIELLTDTVRSFLSVARM